MYDTNVPLVALGAALPASVKAAGGRGVFDGGIRYTAPIAGPADFAVGIFFYQSLHFTGGGTDPYNLTAPWGQAELGFRFSDKPIQDRLSFGYAGGADFIRGAPSLRQLLNFYDGWHHPYARASSCAKVARSTPRSPILRCASRPSISRPSRGLTRATTAAPSVTKVAWQQYYQLPKKLGRVGGGAFFQYQDASGDRWDNVGGGGYVEAEIVLAKKARPSRAWRFVGAQLSAR